MFRLSFTTEGWSIGYAVEGYHDRYLNILLGIPASTIYPCQVQEFNLKDIRDIPRRGGKQPMKEIFDKRYPYQLPPLVPALVAF